MATRSLHNTAKVMEGNPTLMRLKELEVLARVTERIDKITVFGGFESVMNKLVNLPVDAILDLYRYGLTRIFHKGGSRNQ